MNQLKHNMINEKIPFLARLAFPAFCQLPYKRNERH